jgi:hypothetical protein
MTRKGLKSVAFLGALAVAAVLPPATASADYEQWVAINIKVSKSAGAVTIRNASLKWGKWHRKGQKDVEITADDINETDIGLSATIYSCGRDLSSAGTEGSFDLYDGNTKIGTYSWDCPYLSKTNTSRWRSSNDDYLVQCTGGSLDSGALGSIVLDVYKK